MSYPVARLGDTSDHGGKIITASPTFHVEDVPVICPRIDGHLLT
ncbi:hypothetical protein [Hydromonas duriensis]|uniref:PAAR motif-containing protein n=1 Tax=Hydromonas duriensis TaxID=1527608 RepID=A0A4R6Y088_9BURK|nr:hypothetical protein [Hydromonas duriensis]TDR26995.1 hypothetical protein DFR44_1604 [Hydromonas duriensis]